MTPTKHGFSCKSGFRRRRKKTTEHGFSLKSAFTKILFTPNIPLLSGCFPSIFVLLSRYFLCNLSVFCGSFSILFGYYPGTFLVLSMYSTIILWEWDQDLEMAIALSHVCTGNRRYIMLSHISGKVMTILKDNLREFFHSFS